jgi:malonyl-CoA O-methyltransferase
MNEFEIDKKQMRRAFSRAAPDYDATAVMQREVCTRMLERLDYIRMKPAHILDAGSGTGWGTRQLAQRYPAARVVALDIAIGMLRTARGRSGWWQKLFGGEKQLQVCADVEALPLAANSMEMIWSNLAVQWCNDLPGAFAEMHRVLKPDGLLMFSTFGPDTLKELRIAFNGVDRHSHINRFADMHDIGDMLMHSGFAEPVMDMEMLTLTYDDVRGVLQDLKTIGAHNATAGRGQGLMGKNAWARLTENYERLRNNGKLPATFEVVYGHAWKPQPRTTRDGAAIIQTSFKLK